MTLRIFDSQEGDSKLLVSFLGFLQMLLGLRERICECEWIVCGSVNGYGENVCRLDDELLEGAEFIAVDIREVIVWLESGEYFYNARFVCASERLTIGIADSTYLFVDTDDVQFLDLVEKHYRKTQRVNHG